MTTLQTLYETLGHRLNDLDTLFATSGDANSVSIFALSTTSGTVSPNRYDGSWVYNATQHQQRRVRNGGYVHNEGKLPVDPSWSPPSVNDRIDLSVLFPIYQEIASGDTSYIQIANRAAGMLVSPIRVPVPIPTNVPTTSYDLSYLASFLDRQERFGWPDGPDGTAQPKLLEPHPLAGNPVPADWRRPRLRIDGPSVRLDLDVPFAVGTVGSLSLNLMVPAVNWVKPSGAASYGVSTTGMFSEGDEVLPDVNDMVEVMLLEAYNVLSAKGTATATGRWSDLLTAQYARAQNVRYFDVSLFKPASPAAQTAVQSATPASPSRGQRGVAAQLATLLASQGAS